MPPSMGILNQQKIHGSSFALLAVGPWKLGDFTALRGLLCVGDGRPWLDAQHGALLVHVHGGSAVNLQNTWNPSKFLGNDGTGGFFLKY